MDNSSDNCKVSRWVLLKQKLNNLSPAAFREMAGKEEVVLVDCRRRAEYLSGHLPNAVNVDYLSYEFLDEMEQLDPSRKYLVYCRSGRRSIRTCTLMQNGGFDQVYNLDGGLTAWEAQLGLPELVTTP